jgi:hypothetical protein
MLSTVSGANAGFSRQCRQVIGSLTRYSCRRRQGSIAEREGLRVLVDLTKQVSSEAIKVLEQVLAELKRRS